MPKIKVGPKWVHMEAPGLRIGGNEAKWWAEYNAYNGLARGAIFKKQTPIYFLICLGSAAWAEPLNKCTKY